MNIRRLAATALATLLMSSLALADEALTMDYHYAGDTGVDLSAMFGGPLSVATFSDERSDQSLTLTESTPEALVRQTLVEAFKASGADLSETDSSLRLEGKLIDMNIQDGSNGLDVLIRSQLTLRNGSSNAWQSTVFSRIQTTESDAAKALEQGLDGFVTELFRDDYFLMALGIF